MNHTHIHTLRHAPPFSQSAYTNSKPKVTWHNAFSVSNQNVKKKKKKKRLIRKTFVNYVQFVS